MTSRPDDRIHASMTSVFIHEAGHLVIGLRLGIREQGLTFYRTETEAAQAFFTLDTPAKNLRRALAGVLAQLAIIPESIEPAVREAFRSSVILDEFHPDYDKVAEGDRAFASGARDDLNVARKAAEAMVGRDRKQVGECLRGHETEVRALVAANQAAIIAVAEDITAWMETVTTNENPLLLYSPERARGILQRLDSAPAPADATDARNY